MVNYCQLHKYTFKEDFCKLMWNKKAPILRAFPFLYFTRDHIYIKNPLTSSSLPGEARREKGPLRLWTGEFLPQVLLEQCSPLAGFSKPIFPNGLCSHKSLSHTQVCSSTTSPCNYLFSFFFCIESHVHFSQGRTSPVFCSALHIVSIQ